MPCDDVTEVIRLILDDQDVLTNYELIKRSCGRAVGERSLMADEFVGKSAGHLIDWSLDDFAEENPAPSDEEMFLKLKHFFAVQESLRVMLGLEPGGKDEPIRVGHVGMNEEGTTFEADIVVEVITERIKSCGKCKGCGSIAKKIKEKASLAS